MRNFNTGEYEIVLHAICSTLGHAEPGIDDTWSSVISGTIQLVDRHRVIESSYPPNMGTAYMGEELSATFNMPVDCDKDNGNYWFDVKDPKLVLQGVLRGVNNLHEANRQRGMFVE